MSVRADKFMMSLIDPVNEQNNLFQIERVIGGASLNLKLAQQTVRFKMRSC